MVEEVIRLNPELKPLRLRDVEVLENRQIGIEESRSIGDRQKRRPVLAHRDRCGKTVGVDELMPSQARFRVAGYDWVELHRIGSKYRLIVDRDAKSFGIVDDAIRRTRNYGTVVLQGFAGVRPHRSAGRICAEHLHVEVGAGIVTAGEGEVRPTL